MPDAAPPYAVGQHDARPWGEWMVIDCGDGLRGEAHHGATRVSACRCSAIGIAPSSGWWSPASRR